MAGLLGCGRRILEEGQKVVRWFYDGGKRTIFLVGRKARATLLLPRPGLFSCRCVAQLR